jgi:hypothetical protein
MKKIHTYIQTQTTVRTVPHWSLYIQIISKSVVYHMTLTYMKFYGLGI